MTQPSSSAAPDRGGSISWTAPVRIGKVTLRVRDLARVSDFYQRVIGLAVIDSDTTSARLGAGGDVLLELKQDASASALNPREAGLFHTAFLLPKRADLASWIQYIAQNRIAIQGASDHLVSEALYLADPEGNGIEVYVDKPSRDWEWTPDGIRMATERLDIEGLVGAGSSGPWSGAPAGTFVGHIHLQVGELAATESFYGNVMGFDLTTRYPGANFFSTGKYHHHLGTNIWNSRGAGKRSPGSTGLESFELVATSAGAWNDIQARLDKSGLGKSRRVEDPWGTAIELKAA